MTVAEMHDAVKMGVDKSASFQLAAFEDSDIDYWLNESQTQLIKQKMFKNNPRQEGYGEGIKRMEDLSPLVKYSDELTYDAASGPLKAHAYHPNVATVLIEANIPDYLYYVGSDVLIQDPHAPTNTRPQESMLVEESVIGKLISTPYNKPVLRQCYIYLKEGEVNVIYDPFATLDSIYVSYLRKPGRMVKSNPGPGDVTTCELPEHVHVEVVALAVSLMIENIESPRFESQFLTLNNKE